MRKIIVVIAIATAVLLIVASVYFITQQNVNPKIPLLVYDILIKQSGTDYYPIQVRVALPENYTTLFNCFIEVEYLTESNTWKTLSKPFGLLNYGDSKEIGFHLDMDFKNSTQYISQHWITARDEPNIKVEGFGFLKP